MSLRGQLNFVLNSRLHMLSVGLCSVVWRWRSSEDLCSQSMWHLRTWGKKSAQSDGRDHRHIHVIHTALWSTVCIVVLAVEKLHIITVWEASGPKLLPSFSGLHYLWIASSYNHQVFASTPSSALLGLLAAKWVESLQTCTVGSAWFCPLSWVTDEGYLRDRVINMRKERSDFISL